MKTDFENKEISILKFGKSGFYSKNQEYWNVTNINLMTEGINYTVDSDIILMRVYLKSRENSVVKIIRSPEGGSVSYGTIAFVDFSCSILGFFEGIKCKNDNVNISYSKEIPFTLKDNCTYLIEALHFNHSQGIRITNENTKESFEYVVTGNKSVETGLGWGYRSYETSDNVNVISFDNYCLEPYHCKALIVGDSFIEGASIFGHAKERYCSLLKDELNGSVFIDGMGGAKMSKCRERYNTYLKNLCKPKYVLISTGTNDYDFSSYKENLDNFILEIKENGAIPILFTITPREDISITKSCMLSANEYLRNVLSKEYTVIDFNYVLTKNSDGETIIESLFNSDRVHPKVETHKILFEKIKTDWLDKITNDKNV